jgi:SMP-30/Gluconolactonase/LRE-like region
MRPNGIALEPGGRFLMADLGAEYGGIWRLYHDGMVEPVVTEVDGRPLPPTNFVLRDSRGRLWITISTCQIPRSLGYRGDVADGFIVLTDERGTRVVADGLGYANECLLSPAEDYLYVNETFARRLSRFAVTADGQLGARETIANFSDGIFPDGLTIDAEGALWLTSIVSNRVLRIDCDGGTEIVIEDADPAHIAWVEEAFSSGQLGRPHLDRNAGKVLKNISSLAFGGSDLKTGYLGCLLGDSIFAFTSPVAGHPLPHWSLPLDALAPVLAASTKKETE